MRVTVAKTEFIFGESNMGYQEEDESVMSMVDDNADLLANTNFSVEIGESRPQSPSTASSSVGSTKTPTNRKRKLRSSHLAEFHKRLDKSVNYVETDVDEKAKDKGHDKLGSDIIKIEFGRFEIEPWRPFSPEYSGCKKLYFCEFCLNIFKRKVQLQKHMRRCDLKYPPGDEIYCNDSLSIFEIDGKIHSLYGQNLCCLSKLFVDHKALYCDVDLFLFYILCEYDDCGYHILGYFSKEKHSKSYNLAFILTFPPYQRKGYGNFLISFSYELSKKEGKVGTPERPLSNLGLLSYRGYWRRILLEILKKHDGNISIKELSDITTIKRDDIVSTLEILDLIQHRKGRHAVCADPKVLDQHLKAVGPGGLEVDVCKLVWTPYRKQ